MLTVTPPALIFLRALRFHLCLANLFRRGCFIVFVIAKESLVFHFQCLLKFLAAGHTFVAGSVPDGAEESSNATPAVSESNAPLISETKDKNDQYFRFKPTEFRNPSFNSSGKSVIFCSTG